jgi:hypothetical protein
MEAAMITQTLLKTITLYNPFNFPVAQPVSLAMAASEARAWSGEIDEETLAFGLAEASPLPLSAATDVDPDQFELIYTWFLA